MKKDEQKALMGGCAYRSAMERKCSTFRAQHSLISVSTSWCLSRQHHRSELLSSSALRILFTDVKQPCLEWDSSCHAQDIMAVMHMTIRVHCEQRKPVLETSSSGE